jgi:hypothetical protein
MKMIKYFSVHDLLIISAAFLYKKQVKEVFMTKNGPINFVHNFVPFSPGCKGMKSVEKMACSFDLAPEINF